MLMTQDKVCNISTLEFLNTIADLGIKNVDSKVTIALKFIKYKLDESFQSAFRWDFQNQQEFLKQHLLGNNKSVFLYCDPVLCMEELEKMAISSGDANYEYFKSWGKVLLNIDSNNRSQTLVAGYYNLIPFPKGTYYTVQQRQIILSKDTYYKDLPDALKEIFDNTKVLYRLIISATRDSLKETFLSINNGNPLNAQEIRQAEPAKIADEVRKSVKKYNKILNNFFSDKECSRRTVDEFIATMYIIGSIGISKGISKKLLDSVYGHKVKHPDTNVENRLGKVTTDLLPIFTDIARYFPMNTKNKSNGGKSLLMNLALTLSEFRGLDTKKILYDITDRENFARIFFEIETKLRASRKHVLETGGAAKTFAKICQTNGAQNLLKRKELLIKEFLQHPDIDKIVSERYIQDDERHEAASVTNRLILWQNQKGKSTHTNKKIPFIEILNTAIWQVNHIIPVTRGGKNDIGNLELIEATINASIGNKMPGEL